MEIIYYIFVYYLLEKEFCLFTVQFKKCTIQFNRYSK